MPYSNESVDALLKQTGDLVVRLRRPDGCRARRDRAR